MKSMKLALVMALFAVTYTVGLEKASFTKKNGSEIQITDPEIIQIQSTLQDLGAEHLASQKHMGVTVATTIQNKINELKNKLSNLLTPEQRAEIQTQIGRLKVNLQKYKKTAPAA